MRILAKVVGNLQYYQVPKGWTLKLTIPIGKVNLSTETLVQPNATSREWWISYRNIYIAALDQYKRFNVRRKG